tara:strand:+ start:14724 stop:15947 length:1224 start_codon:yes stop_codon:yes gene_type:complete
MMQNEKKVFIYRGIKVLYQDFIPNGARKLKPLVVLPGHLQTAKDLANIVAALSKFSPVILVEMPGWGSNSSHPLNDVDSADVLAKFFEERGLRGANLLAIGDSTAVAYFFAYMYPRWLGKLVLSGVAARLRDAVRTLFKGNIDALANAEKDRFLTGMHAGILNHSKRTQIDGYQKAKDSLYEVLLGEISNEDPEAGINRLQRYLGRDDLPDGVKVPTLLVAGEYDPYTSVHDHFLVARRLETAQLAVISGTDHQCVVQKPNEFSMTVLSFLVKGSVSPMAGVRVHDNNEIPGYLRQIYPRVHLDEIGFIESKNGAPIPINIKDMNIYGCQLFTLFGKHRAFNESRLTLRLSTNDVEDFKLDLSFFSQNRGTFKGVFHHSSLDLLESLETMLERFQQENTKKHSLISA